MNLKSLEGKMHDEVSHKERAGVPPVFVVSGGAGASGEQLVRTALAQFTAIHVPVEIVPHVHNFHAVKALVVEAQARGAVIVHTLVDAGVRRSLEEFAVQHNVATIDAMGPLLSFLSQALNRVPLGQPGRYRQLYNSYFKRIEAIEFTVAHDDGKRLADLDQADIVLTGVSRAGKTPVSIYLSMQGWKVANVPFVPDLAAPKELLEVERQRVVALTLQPQQLMLHRRTRLPYLGLGASAYVDIKSIVEELRAAQHLFARQGFVVIDMTDKPIETGAEEVLSHVIRETGRGGL
jgi:[pyruvate, water dikinase]-phosphate phosphotransferase / [pyruvate, water dikinase] kinase